MRARSSRSRTSRSSRPLSVAITRAASPGSNAPSPSPSAVPADRRQRRLQLVAHGEQERTLGVARRSELLDHLVERLGERGELGRAFGLERLVTLVGGERARGRRDALDRTHDRAREQERQHGRDAGAGERSR